MKSFMQFYNIIESCLVKNQNLQVVKDIEKIAYPHHLHFYQDFDSIEDLIDYSDCDGKIDCIIQPNWYAIFCNGPTEVEIIDVASKSEKLNQAEIFTLWRKINDL